MGEKLTTLARGIGQIMLQRNAFSGVLMLAGISCNSWILALLALAGNVVATCTAHFSGYPLQEIRDGIYGFNATLVAIAVGVFMPVNVISMLLLIIGAALSVPLTRWFCLRSKLPGLTAPFILIVWGMLAGCHYLSPSLLFPSPVHTAEYSANLFQAFSLNIGQVMLQDKSLFSGLFFLAGVLVNSRLSAAYALWGACLPLAAVWFTGTDYSGFNAGLIGYNAVLCSIAFAGASIRDFSKATLSALLSVVLQIAGMQCGIISLTAPFVLSVWVVIGIDRSLRHRRKNQSD